MYEGRQLTLLQEDTLASPSVLPEAAKETPMTAIYGRKCCGWCESADPLGLLGRMLKGTLPLDSIPFAMTWKRQGTPSNRTVFRLVRQGRTTKESEFSLWPTPQAMDAMTARSPAGMDKQMNGARKGRSKIATMKDAAVYGLNWTGKAVRLGDGELNPRHLEWMQGYPLGWTEIKHLAIQ